MPRAIPSAWKCQASRPATANCVARIRRRRSGRRRRDHRGRERGRQRGQAADGQVEVTHDHDDGLGGGHDEGAEHADRDEVGRSVVDVTGALALLDQAAHLPGQLGVHLELARQVVASVASPPDPPTIRSSTRRTAMPAAAAICLVVTRSPCSTSRGPMAATMADNMTSNMKLLSSWASFSTSLSRAMPLRSIWIRRSCTGGSD